MFSQDVDEPAYPMIAAYLKLALRLLFRNPFFTLINVVGLAVGFASFFILWQHATTELKTDQHHRDADRIVRVALNYRWSDDGSTWGLMTSGAIRPYYAPDIASNFREVEAYTRILQQPWFSPDVNGHGQQVIVSLDRNGDKELFEEDRVVYADPNLFEFFTIPLVYGDNRTVLKNAGSVVISQTKAIQYFGARNPMGGVLMINDSIPLTVTGVFADLPQATHLAFDVVISDVGLQSSWQEYGYGVASSYFRLDNAEHIKDFEIGINQYAVKHFNRNLDPAVTKIDLFAQPLTEIAFREPFEYDFRPRPKSRSILLLLQVVSVLVLIMAWINYINLSVSRMVKRMKEVATRKVSGALSSDFLTQFLVESCVINLLAVAISLTAVQLIRIPAKSLFEIHVPEFNSITVQTWTILGLAIVLGILTTGLFPALMSASFNPRSLFAFSKMGRVRRSIQSLLTIGQYSAALVLIVWAFFVYLQLSFILDKDLGLRRQQVVIVDAPVIKSSTYLADFEHFLNSVRSIPGVQDATFSHSIVGDLKVNLFRIGRTPSVIIGMDTNGGVDESFIPFYGINILAGRNFNSSDKDKVVLVSRYAAKRVGFDNPADAVGATVVTNSGVEDVETLKIIGVFDDYRFKPLVNLGGTSSETTTGRGICLVYKNHLVDWFYPEKLSLRIEPDLLQEALAEVEKGYQSVFAGNFFKWYFLDRHINQAYDNDKITRNQVVLFALLAIGISCLGLLGMMTTLAEQKTKEIGIRKVLGAGISQIAKALLKGVSSQMMVAVLLALPISYYLAEQFLNRYIERIEIQWWHFVLPITLMLAIMIGTVSSVLLKAARNNPVEALKYE